MLKTYVVLPDYEQPNFRDRNQAKLRISGPGRVDQAELRKSQDYMRGVFSGRTTYL